MLLFRRHSTYHTNVRVTSKGILQNVGELRVAIGNVRSELCQSNFHVAVNLTVSCP